MKAIGNARAVVAQPLYAQVRERLMERIVGKEWRQGEMLPNEFDLARQFSVSIGTIRKAVEGLEAARIVVRKQGRGTYVARENATPVTEPVSWSAGAGLDELSAALATLSVVQREALPREIAALELLGERAVIAIRRRRRYQGGAAVLDHIVLPRHLFFDLETSEPMPANLYEFYGDYFGVRAVKWREQISAVAAGDEVPIGLGVLPGVPLLKIERTCYTVGSTAMEWRESFCILPQALAFEGAC